MQPLQIDESTKMNYVTPVLMQDGNLISLTENGAGNLSFYQIRKVTGNHIDELDVVASIHVANVEDLKNYRDTLTQVIDNYNVREK
jgi:hypothetical protein